MDNNNEEEYIKDFDNWSILKQEIHHSERERIYFKPREIYNAHLGVNIGSEADGKDEVFLRPVLVIKKIGNLFFVVPMTTKGKEDSPFYYSLPYSYFDKDSSLMLSQARIVDRKRLIRKI
ncbi:MAG: type II toxin-antitoxin system PemK/MazF family toxin [Flavobacteriales bacterium]|jgi:mRNA-degrading endonuclease toxin of MazEF toxin-antitoxin module|nr:type II toxin-antitoxin system PemK/MazF family toxin [Flavobacteriales bacterium]